MNISFELLSSMSPKVDRTAKLPRKKVPTKLALKKHFRRTSILFKDLDKTVISVSSTTSSSSESYIVIHDSDEDDEESSESEPEVKNGDVQLLPEKYNTIKSWVDEVNTAQESLFSNVSVILPGDNAGFKCPLSYTSSNSTFAMPVARRFDEFFENNDKVDDFVDDSLRLEELRIEEKNLEIDDSLLTDDRSGQSANAAKAATADDIESDELGIEDKMKKVVLELLANDDKEHTRKTVTTINDSLLVEDENKRSDVNSLITNDQTPHFIASKNTNDCESLLDSIYGKSWRAKKDKVLPSSEPRPKAAVRDECPKTSNIYRNPYLYDHDNKLSRILQQARFKKAVESPWANTLKNLCDPDSDSDSDSHDKLLPTRLDFNDAKTTKEPKITQFEITKRNTNDLEAPFSFLASLSKRVIASRCDMSALIYRTDFQQHKKALTTKLFTMYNEKIFENAIPSDMEVSWNDKIRKSAGYCRCRKFISRNGTVEYLATIELSSKVVDSADRLRDTLVHEMCHAASWMINKANDGHGQFWRRWANKAMKVFPELPPIERCHQYKINTKYTYKCKKCGNSIGRHTKSIDIEKKRCGFCMGKFEILINKKTKQGETKAVPVTPKTPSGFALFVKENYATHKTPDLTHGDIMKCLGQKFTALKCGSNHSNK